MFKNNLVALPCHLYPGMFSSERVFEVTLADEKVYKGLAPRHFCWNARGEIVQENEETNNIPGLVAAKIVYWIDDDRVAVEVPDGEVLAVRKGIVKSRPTDISPKEGAPNVPVG